MVKHGNNPRGKSDKHQLHNKKYASTHLEAELTRWYEKITTPKPTKPKQKRVVFSVNNTTITPSLTRQEEIKECERAFKRSLKKTRDTIRLVAYKRKTHWVARSYLEVEQMFSDNE